jgi:glutathione S-transferase
MSALALTMVAPLAEYLDEATAGSRLAPREPSLDGKIIALLPNWRPSAVEILQALGQLLGERFRLKQIVIEQPVRELPIRTGKLLDTMKQQLDDLASRVDAVITATGD